MSNHKPRFIFNCNTNKNPLSQKPTSQIQENPKFNLFTTILSKTHQTKSNLSSLGELPMVKLVLQLAKIVPQLCALIGQAVAQIRAQNIGNPLDFLTDLMIAECGYEARIDVIANNLDFRGWGIGVFR